MLSNVFGVRVGWLDKPCDGGVLHMCACARVRREGRGTGDLVEQRVSGEVENIASGGGAFLCVIHGMSTVYLIKSQGYCAPENKPPYQGDLGHIHSLQEVINEVSDAE